MKKILYILCLVIGIVLIDSAQALILNNPPFIGIETRGMMKKGILVDTYFCNPDDKHTVLKGVKYACHVKIDYTLVDKTVENEDMSFDTALQNFFEDDNYVYYWDCIKDEYMIVRYATGEEIRISDALKANKLSIQELDDAGIKYIKNERQKVELQSPPALYLYVEGDNNKAQALLGTYSWRITKCGESVYICADSLHPSEMKYKDENILKYNNSNIFIESENALISSVNIYDVNKTEKIKKIYFDNEKIMLGNLTKGEYALEIVASYDQGNVYYGLKILVE